MGSNIKEYQDSTLFAKLERQREDNIFQGKTLIAFSDIDGTYISTFKASNIDHIRNFTPNPWMIEFQKIRYNLANESLTKYLEDYSIPVVAVTGRQLDEVLRGQSGGLLYQEEHLPFFDIIASSLGTQIFIAQKGKVRRYLQDDSYNTNIEAETGFEYTKLYPICEEFIANMNKKFPGIDCGFMLKDQKANLFKFDLKENRAIYPDRYRIALCCKKDILKIVIIEELMNRWLIAHSLPHVQVVVCEGENEVNIDIASNGKDKPIKYLMELTKADMGIVAGDSGNDKLMLLSAPTAAVIAGGYKQELVDGIKSIPGIKSTEYYFMLPNGVPIYIEPKHDALSDQQLGPESLQLAFAAYISHLISKDTKSSKIQGYKEKIENRG